MDTADAFRTAMAGHRVEEAEALLHPDVTFLSPVVHRPYRGRDHTMPILYAVAEVFADFRYDRTYTAGDGAVLTFAARVGDRVLHGVDQLTIDADGRITELAVYIRPLSALQALQAAMAERLAG